MNKDTFHILDDFNWEEHSYSILHKYLPPVAEALNKQSEFAFKMTKGCYGNRATDTKLFRDSIHMYLMSIFGIKDDAVQYTKINKVL
jgi:hypothetical protein